MPLTTQPFAHSREIDAVQDDLYINVPFNERIGSVAAGAALIALGLWRRSWATIPLLLGGATLVHRGATGYCHLYKRLGINSGQLNTESGVPGNKGFKITEEITIARPATDIYAFWRSLENLTRFMDHVESIEQLDAERSHWTVRAPAGTTVEWTATIITDRPGELIAWESLPGAEVQNAGSVRFEPVENGSSTKVKVTLEYQPPAGILGATVAKLLGEAPVQQLQEDLERLKELLENQPDRSRFRQGE